MSSFKYQLLQGLCQSQPLKRTPTQLYSLVRNGVRYGAFAGKCTGVGRVRSCGQTYKKCRTSWGTGSLGWWRVLVRRILSFGEVVVRTLGLSQTRNSCFFGGEVAGFLLVRDRVFSEFNPHLSSRYFPTRQFFGGTLLHISHLTALILEDRPFEPAFWSQGWQ